MPSNPFDKSDNSLVAVLKDLQVGCSELSRPGHRTVVAKYQRNVT